MTKFVQIGKYSLNPHTVTYTEPNEKNSSLIVHFTSGEKLEINTVAEMAAVTAYFANPVNTEPAVQTSAYEDDKVHF